MSAPKSSLITVLEQAGLATTSFTAQFDAYSCADLFETLQHKQLYSESTLHHALSKVLSLRCASLADLEPDPRLAVDSKTYLPLYETKTTYTVATSNPYMPIHTPKNKELSFILVKHHELQDRFSASKSYDLTTLIQLASSRHVSDIHFFEQQNHDACIYFREHGQLIFYAQLSTSEYSSLKQHIKLDAHLDLSLHQRPQDGQLHYAQGDTHYDLRISVLPTVHGEDIVCRLFNQRYCCQTLSDLGVSKPKEHLIYEMCNHGSGLILVTGPTGSGKTTTLYTLLRYLQSKDRGVITTLEDPVEKHLQGIRQSSIKPDNNYTFSAGLKAILRQDPDIIMVGEIRDAQTAHIALEAAYTGHLVLSSLHTHDVRSTLLRLKHFGCDPFLMSYALRGIISQHLKPTGPQQRTLFQEVLACKEQLQDDIFNCKSLDLLGDYLELS